VTQPTRALLLKLVVLGVAVHSIVLGLCLLCFPTWVLKLVGWEYTGEMFWPSQAGLFLIILGSAYAAALRYRPLIWLLIGSKGCAVVFLWAHVLFLGAPRLAGLLGTGDGLMGLVTAVLFVSVLRGERRQLAAESRDSSSP
jgi:hypothetical protein